MKTFLLACCVLLSLTAYHAQAQSPQYAIVVGAFSVEANANKFSKLVKSKNFKPVIQRNEEKNLFYVVVQQTDDHDAVIEQTKKLQGSVFRDAWVFNRNPAPPVIEQPKPEPVVEQPKPVIIEEPKVVEIPKPKKISPEDSARMAEEKIKAEVGKKIMATKKGTMEKLDYIYFYRDASVLRPESKFAIDELLNLLKENPKQVIRIHGHTNGNDPGKIIRRTEESTDFFSLKNTIEDYGSAKELSLLRAEQIRDYLVASGIEKGRMSIKAWGGKKPLFPVDDDRAEANVRVEIEIVK
jgi:outer membrane protein OmpA-like peptidoglycan-associated protein